VPATPVLSTTIARFPLLIMAPPPFSAATDWTLVAATMNWPLTCSSAKVPDRV
jgi:hypothetical protein